MELQNYLSSGINGYNSEIEYCLRKMASDTFRQMPENVTAFEAFFVVCFFENEMIVELPFHMNRLLRKYRGVIPKGKEYTDIDEILLKDMSASLLISCRCLNEIYNLAKYGDTDCIRLMKYLYQNYHQKQYRFLKRCRTVNYEELDSAGFGHIDIVVALGMCRLMNITAAEDLLAYMYMATERFLHDIKKESQHLSIPKKIEKESFEKIHSWMMGEGNKKVRCRQYENANKFVTVVCRYIGLPDLEPDTDGQQEEFLDTVLEQHYNMKQAYAFMKLIWPGKEPTYDTVQTYGMIYYLLTIMKDNAEIITNSLNLLFDPQTQVGEPTKFCYKEESAYKQTDCYIGENEDIPKQESMHTKEEALQKKITELEKLLAEALDIGNNHKQFVLQLKEENNQLKAAIKEKEKILEEKEQALSELSALRKYAYEQTQEFSDETQPYVVIREELRKHKIMIIGGHVNWHNKLRTEYPSWKMVAPDAVKTPTPSLFAGMEKIYFFTDHISHTTYNRYVDVLQQNKIEFRYISCVNIEQMSLIIYKELN